jgi:type II secretory pathway predicted ATPase ExeA
MYEKFYGFRERPFALNPDPQFLYLAAPHRRALAVLEYALTTEAPFCLITGEVGSGKTTMLRYVLNTVATSHTIGLISNTSTEFTGILPWICNAFGIDHRAQDAVALHQRFTDFLVDEYSKARKVLLVIDEAQNLNARRLEELRVLSNINSEKHLVLQTILVGQPELRETIRSPGLRQLAQRISADQHIDPLTLEECRIYVRHRLRKAGGKVSLFTNTAIRVAFEQSHGIPRLINQYCDRALVHGYADHTTVIDGDIMADVVKDRLKTGLVTQ